MSEAAGSTSLEDQIAAFDPTNPEALAALEKAAMGGQTAEVPDPMNGSGLKSAADELSEAAGNTDGAGKQDEKITGQQPAAGEGATSGVTEPKGVQAKDGQHIIPYSVLERERDRASRAEQSAQALAAQLEKLRSGTATAATATDEAIQLTDDDLMQLDTDLPAVAKIIRAQMQTIEKLTGAVQTLKQGQETQQVSAEQARRDEEEAAIAANENLTALRSTMDKDPKALARWNRVVDTYQSLREDPDLFELDTASLINKAEQSVAAIYGPVAKAAAAPATPAAAKPNEPQQAADLKQAADAALKAQPGTVPTSLSDFPGGIPPAQNDMETLANASSVQLGQKFLSMSPEALESYLARVA